MSRVNEVYKTISYLTSESGREVANVKHGLFYWMLFIIMAMIKEIAISLAVIADKLTENNP